MGILPENSRTETDPKIPTKNLQVPVGSKILYQKKTELKKPIRIDPDPNRPEKNRSE